MTDPQNAKYLVHDPNIEETYYCEKAVIADEWEYEDGDEGREYRIEKIQP